MDSRLKSKKQSTTVNVVKSPGAIYHKVYAAIDSLNPNLASISSSKGGSNVVTSNSKVQNYPRLASQ